ncbi:MAG: gliding motility-associated C-terminal domain-containing protein [Bacteroidota bacterium]
MKKIYIVLLCVFAFNYLQSQSDNCSGAVPLTIGSCVTGSPGATQNLAGCVGNADDDAWYKFTATSASHLITVTGSSGYDAVIQLLSGGTCSSLSSLNCVDNTLSGQAETINATGLTIGVTYYLRVYDYYTGTSAGTFTTCVTLPPPAPGNDNCSGAKVLTVNAACVTTATTSYGATQSMTGCSGTADDDVWFMFTANNYTQTIQVAGSSGMDAVVELFSGTCAALSSITCQDVTFTGGTETISASGLNPGSTYYVRVYDYYSTGGYPFNICITGATIIVGTQPNDEPCNAIQLPAVTADCNYLSFSNVGATLSAAAAPTGCTGGTGGFGATTKDVWFSITVPASGNLCITPQPNLATSTVTDGVMVLYSGSCGSLTQIDCSDDADGTSGIYNYPGTANDFLPYINQTGLTPGSTVYLRYWGWGGSSGSFGLCVQAPTNDACANALYICDLNGYSASTSPAYTPDRPGTGAGQMYANNETPAGVNQPDGTNTGGPFGYYPPSNIAGPYSSPAIDVNIENNSWIRFTAGSATANLRVTVGNCWVGSYPSGGIQMQIFSGTNCNNFAPVSSFKEGSNTFTVTANGLTVGSDYYLMVDGYARDICKYTIQVLDGVALPEITAAPDSICPGQNSLLTAPLGATGYTWYPTGSTPITTRTISVSPGATQTYTCIAGGVCGQKQTLTKTVFVKTVPNVLINSGAAIAICGPQTITLTGSGANTYTWSTSNTTTSFTVAPVSNTTYSVIGRASNGCTNTAVSIVTVNPIPNITVAGTNTICFGQSTTLTASGGTSYTWTPGGTVASSITVNPTTTTVYNVTGTNAFGCTKTVSVQVVVNGLPTVSSTSTTICFGNSGTISASGASTYTWSTGTVATGITVNPSTTTTYTVTGTNLNGCTNTAVGQVSVNALPTVLINSGNPVSICNTQTVTLTGSGGITYTWSTGSNAGNINVSPTTNTTYTLTGTAATGCSNTAVTTVTVNALPGITITGPNTVCNGKSIVLTGNGGTSYTWTPGGAATSITVSPSSNTTYTVTGSGANGCPASAVTTITVNALPVVTVSNATVCNGSSVVLTGSGSSVSYSWNTGATTSTVSVNPAVNTNYTVTGTAANSCTNAAIAQVTVTALPVITVPSATICQNSTQVLTASGANTYTWSTTQTGPSISVTPTTSTTYTVKGTAVTSCTNTAIVNITVNTLPQLTSTPSVSPSNCGASTGSITNVSVTGSPVLSYTWTNGASATVGSAPTLNNQPAGTYNLQVKDGNGCISSFGPYSITNPGAPIAPTANATATSICVGQTINLNANSASGGTYNWSGPSSFTTTTQNPTINNATGAMGGVYSVFITASGCSGPATSVTVAVNALPTPNATASQTVYCVGNTANLFASTATTYTWSGPGSFSSNNQNPSITNIPATAAGVYTLGVTNTNGCQGTTTVAIGVNTNPVATATANPASLCAGQTINLNSGGGSGYNWTGPNGYSNSTQAPNIPNAGTVNAGSYTVVVTGANTCTSSAVTSVSINPLPTFTSSVNAANICNGATIQFNAGSAANTYSWTGPATYSVNNNASPFINGANVVNSGTYTVTANSGSCTATQTLAVNVYPAVSLTATATSTAVCQGSTLQLLGNGGSSYQWNGPGSFSSTSQSPQITTIPVSASGVYTLSVMDGNNCPGTKTVSVLVNANPTATASANPNVICVGNTINLNSGGGSTYSWSGPNGFSNATQNPSIPNAGSPNVGDYTVTVTDGNLCSSTAIASVTIVTLPTFTMTSNGSNICYGGTIQFNAGSGPYTYSWSGPASYTVANSTSPSITDATPLNSGTYTVTSSAGSCSYTQTLSVNVYPQILVNASATSYVLCSGSVANLTGTGGGTYSWTGPDNFSTTTQNPQIPNVQANAAGIYTLTVTDSNTNCSASDTVKLTVSPAPALVSVLGDSTCFGQQLQLNANFGTGVTVNWYSDAGLTNLLQANSNTYQTTPTANGTYTYYVQGVVGSCKSNVAAVTGMFYNIRAVATADVYTGDAPLTVNFTGSNSVGVTASDNFNWTFGDNTGSNLVNPNHIFTAEASYTVVLTVTDSESGCMDTATVIIKVEDDLTVVVPNVFTPNGDGTNDAFHVKIKGAKSAEGFIYNRWGQLLFSWDVLNASWDGIASNGEKCPDATYFYLIKVVDKKDKEHLFPGYTLLIR